MPIPGASRVADESRAAQLRAMLTHPRCRGHTLDLMAPVFHRKRRGISWIAAATGTLTMPQLRHLFGWTRAINHHSQRIVFNQHLPLEFHQLVMPLTSGPDLPPKEP